LEDKKNMAVGSVRWTGSFTLPATGPGIVSSVDVALATLGATDCVVATPSHTSLQTGLLDVKGTFKIRIVKNAGVGFTVHADRPQLPESVVYDYVIYTLST
jgi:hypothetical protein